MEVLFGEDPGLKYLFLKGIITQEEYDKGLRVLETREQIAKPNYSIDVNNGLNFRVGSKFFLKLRLLTQVRYSHTYNGGWGTVGDSRIPRSSAVRWNTEPSVSKATPASSACRACLQFTGLRLRS